jgi:hypothetical protein
MTSRPSRLTRTLPGAGALALLLPGAAAAVDAGSLQGLLYSNILVNLAFATAIVFLGIFGLYAYASLARFAPYHTWIYLYLVSLTGIAWALFMAVSGGSLPDVVFVLTTVIGLNLIVHVLRFDRIEIPSPFGASPAAAGQR